MFNSFKEASLGALWLGKRACSKVSLSSLGGTLGKALLGHLRVYTDRLGSWAGWRGKEDAVLWWRMVTVTGAPYCSHL